MDKSETASQKTWTPLLYQRQEICPWMEKNTCDKTQQSWCCSITPEPIGFILLPPFSRFQPPPVCCPCAWLPASALCWTLAVGLQPKQGICEATSSIWESQDRVVPVACGRDLGTEEKWGRHKHRAKERISVLSPLAEQREEAASLSGG